MKNRLTLIIVLIALAALAFTWHTPRSRGGYDVTSFTALPTLVNGRIKPLDTVARSTLLEIQGRQRVQVGAGQSLTPGEWLLDMFFRPAAADDYSVFEIVHPEVLALFGFNPEDGAGGKRFSARQLKGGLAELDRQGKLAADTEAPVRTGFQRAVLRLRENVMLYQRLQTTFVAPGTDDFLERVMKLEGNFPAAIAVLHAPRTDAIHDSQTARLVLDLGSEFSTMDSYSYLRPIPPKQGNAPQDWSTVGGAWAESLAEAQPRSTLEGFAQMGRAWHDHQPEVFNAAANRILERTRAALPGVMKKASVEMRFNAAEPFFSSMALYIAAFVVAVCSWLKWGEALRRVAFAFVVVAFIVATAGIGIRMWLEARPPVTNLYSSALFVGWVAVGLCLALEFFYRNAIGSAAAGLIGFSTLLIAHHLALGGDTLEMMRAVLDSNFWLGTHVVTITVGYSATFLAGWLALIYVLRGVLTRTLDERTAESLGRMMYGIICFATLFSLVGTILGGIWADQSWGRFWGWDPKENGALVIVVWNSLILHARWGGMVGRRGLAVLAIFGNVVTAWSWFGVNMLGVGLHSYGFMDAAFWWLIAFVISQLAIMLLAALPMSKWRSAFAFEKT